MAEKDTKPYWSEALAVFARMSVWIAGPVVLGLFAGRWLDAKYRMAPYLFLATMGLAFLVSAIGIVREARIYLKTIETKKTDENNPDQK